MKIGVIGAGNVGKALAGAFTKGGHDVVISAKSHESAEVAAKESGAQAAGSNLEASESADAVVLAVPYDAVGDVLTEIGDALAGKILIDVTNPLNSDYSGLQTYEKAETERIQEKVPAAKVVKALNTVLAARQADPQVAGETLDGFLAGDDSEAKETVSDLVDQIGLRSLDVGPVAMARSLEGLAFLNISLNAAGGWPWQSGWKLVGPTG